MKLELNNYFQKRGIPNPLKKIAALTGDGELTVRHRRNDGGDNRYRARGTDKREYPRRGKCSVEIRFPLIGNDNVSITLRGSSECSWSDQYNKRDGIALAVYNAVQNAYPDNPQLQLALYDAIIVSAPANFDKSKYDPRILWKLKVAANEFANATARNDKESYHG